MLETALTIYEIATAAHDSYKRINTLIFGDKKEEYLQQIATDMKDMKTHIERLSDGILYAANFDGVRTSRKSQYTNELRELRQLLEPIHKASKQPILSSAIIQAPPPIETRNPRDFLEEITELKDTPEPDDDWIPVLFEENGLYFIGWKPPTYFSQRLGCEYLPHWQINDNRFSGENLIEIASLLPQQETIKPPPLERATIFEFEIVTVDERGKITNRAKKQAPYQTENLPNNVALDMVYIPGGTFMMGAPKGEEGRSGDEGPQHEVTIAPFYMGKYSVTQAQWQAVMGNNPSNFKGEKRPVENISWDDAVKFCQKVSELTGKPYRLPSEAEWEYACRAGTTTPFYFGKTITTDLANYNGDFTYAKGPKGKYRKQTTEVGIFPPNAFGLYDMHGNVWEWCADPWHDNYEGAPTDGSVWKGDSADRLLRGGSWYVVPSYCRCAYRCSHLIVDDKRGLRLALSVAAWT